MRKIGPVRAAFSNFLGFGLGYVYVGRIQYAFLLLATVIGVSAMAGWSRLVLDPYGFYIVLAIMLGIGLFSITHSGLIAWRNRQSLARRYNRWWFYLLWILASWFLSKGVIAMRPVMLGFEPFNIPAASMAPTMQQGDLVMTDTWRYRHTAPEYGELIVFGLPGNIAVKYVKRVVGLPGDVIEVRDDVLYRNGETIDEPYIQLTPDGSGMARNFGPVTTPDESYFMLGDNRHRSRDSRYLGAINRDLLHSRVEYRWFAFRDGIRWDRFPERLATEEN